MSEGRNEEDVTGVKSVAHLTSCPWGSLQSPPTSVCVCVWGHTESYVYADVYVCVHIHRGQRKTWSMGKQNLKAGQGEAEFIYFDGMSLDT